MTIGEHVDEVLKWSGYSGAEEKTIALLKIKKELEKEIFILCAIVEEKMKLWKIIDNEYVKSDKKEERSRIKLSRSGLDSHKTHKPKL